MLEPAPMLPASEANRCPHCHVVADVERHAALGFSCLVCGGPRLALDAAQLRLGAETNALLVSAAREQTKHIVFSAAGLLLTGMGALALVIASVVVLAAAPGLLPSVAAYAGAAVPVVAGLLALSRAAGARGQRAKALRAAQVRAIADVQANMGPVDARRAAELLRIDADQAELLLAEANVASLLEEAPAPRLRIDAPAATVLATESELDQARAEGQAAGQRTRGDTEI
jgi:hypothetical protein